MHPHGGLKRNSETNKVKMDNKTSLVNPPKTISKKIFISHASKDKDLVGELIDLLENIGLDSHQIFCSSFEGYGIPLGEDFLEIIKKELCTRQKKITH